MIPSASCLSDEQLTPLAVGEDSTPEVREHLERCQECQERLRRLQREITSIRQAARATSLSFHFDTSKDAPPRDAQAGAAGVEALDGRALGRYVLLEKIGQGGMGVVYKARHERMGRTVAIKLLSYVATGDEAVRRFQREVRAAAQLSHPNIVTAYDADEADGRHFLVMEYVEGSNLASQVDANGPLPVDQALQYVRQAASALQYAHDKGIIHRDVKPGNLLLDRGNNVKVLDMGLARIVPQNMLAEPSADGLTAAGQIMGSLDYMAPEQATEPNKVDARADIYGLGCTLFYLLTGQRIYEAETVLKTIVAHREQPIPSIRDIRADVPAAVDALFQAMVAKDPARRPAAMSAVIAALDQCGQPAAKRTSRIAVLLGVLVLVMAVGLYFGWYPPHFGVHVYNWPVKTADPIESNAEAYELYQKGQGMLERRNELQADLAIRNLQNAVQLAPNSALAHTALADAYNLCSDYGWKMADQVYPKAKEAAATALKLNDRLGEAHLAMAFTLHGYECDHRRAEAEYLRAIELNPDSAKAHHWYAWFLVLHRRLDEGEREMKRAHQLEPKNLIIACNMGKTLYYGRSYQVAVEKYKEALDQDADFRKAHWDLGLAYAELGKLQESIDEFSRTKALTEDGRDLDASRAYAYARNGQPDTARSLLAKLEPLADTKPLAYEITTIYAAMGDKDKAFAWLERAFRERSSWRSYIKADPKLDNLRTDPRFKDFLKRAGFDD